MANYIISEKKLETIVFKFIDSRLPNVCEGVNWVYFQDRNQQEFTTMSYLKQTGILYINTKIINEIRNMFNLEFIVSIDSLLKYVKVYKGYDNLDEYMIIEAGNHPVLKKLQTCKTK